MQSLDNGPLRFGIELDQIDIIQFREVLVDEFQVTLFLKRGRNVRCGNPLVFRGHIYRQRLYICYLNRSEMRQ